MPPGGDVRGKLQADVPETAFQGDDGGVDEGEGETAILRGVVCVGDGAGGEVSQDIGEVGLGVAIIAAADEGCGEGVAEARFDGAGSLAKETRILVEEDGVDGAGEHGAVEGVCVVGSGAFEVSGGSPAVAAMGVTELAGAGEDEGSDDVEGVGCGVDGKFRLLAPGEGDAAPADDGVEVGDDGEDALLLLGFDLAGTFGVEGSQVGVGVIVIRVLADGGGSVGEKLLRRRGLLGAEVRCGGERHQDDGEGKLARAGMHT